MRVKPPSFTQGKELITRVSANRVLRRIFGPKRQEVTEGWSKLYNEELYNLCLQKVIRMIKSSKRRCKGNVEYTGEKRNIHKFLLGKPEGKTSLGRFRYIWYNIKMDLKEGWAGPICLKTVTSGRHLRAW
jgi:hypothetical protein